MESNAGAVCEQEAELTYNPSKVVARATMEVTSMGIEVTISPNSNSFSRIPVKVTDVQYVGNDPVCGQDIDGLLESIKSIKEIRGPIIASPALGTLIEAEFDFGSLGGWAWWRERPETATPTPYKLTIHYETLAQRIGQCRRKEYSL